MHGLLWSGRMIGHPVTGQGVAVSKPIYPCQEIYLVCPFPICAVKYLVLAGITTMLCPHFLGFTFLASGVGAHQANEKRKKPKQTSPYIVGHDLGLHCRLQGLSWTRPTGGDGNPSPVCVPYTPMFFKHILHNKIKQLTTQQ